MSSSALLTLIAIVASIEGGQATVKGELLAYLHPGDAGQVQYEITVGNQVRTIDVGTAEVLSVGAAAAEIRVDADRPVLPGFGVRFEVPIDRMNAEAAPADLELAEALAAARSDVATAVASGKALSARIGELEGEVATARAEREKALEADDADRLALARKLEAAENDRERLKEALAVAGAKDKEASLALNDLRGELVVARSRTKSLEAAIGEERKLRTESETALDESSSVAEVLTRRSSELESRLASARLDLDKARKMGESLSAQLEEERAGRKSLGEQLGQVEAELAAVRKSGSDLAAQLDQERDATRSKTAETNAAQKMLEESLARGQALSIRIGGLEAELEEARVDLAEAQASREALAILLDEERAGHPTLETEPSKAKKVGVIQEQPTATPEELEARVLAWGKAWSEQDVEKYLRFYADEYRPPSGVSRGRWEAQRRQRLSAPEFIEVKLENFAVVSATPGHSQVRFDQTYRSDTFEDRVTKTLRLLFEDRVWKIAAEEAMVP